MKHGYTNRTDQLGRAVRKTYQGPDAAKRQAAETRALTALQGLFPVPPLLDEGDGWLEVGFVDGRHGQDLIDEGHAAEVLHSCGRALRHLQTLDPRLFDPALTGQATATGQILRHGDFGPNNLLFDDHFEVVAALDWEFSRVGEPIADLAWCEFIVRMHHADEVDALPALFEGYGATPPWAHRQQAMLERCDELLDFVTLWNPRVPGSTSGSSARRPSAAGPSEAQSLVVTVKVPTASAMSSPSAVTTSAESNTTVAPFLPTSARATSSSPTLAGLR